MAPNECACAISVQAVLANQFCGVVGFRGGHEIWSQVSYSQAAKLVLTVNGTAAVSPIEISSRSHQKSFRNGRLKFGDNKLKKDDAVVRDHVIATARPESGAYPRHAPGNE